MKNKFFEGVYSAIFSVYDENLNVKTETVEKLVDYQLSHGVRGFYVCGNTGECTVLPVKTRIQMLDTVVKANKGRGQIMAHIGAAHLDQVKVLLEDANNRDIDAVSSLPPTLTKYYSADEILEYYKWLAKESRHPVYAYITNVLNADPTSFAEKLSQIDNIQGIKLTIPDYFAFANLMDKYKGKMNILNGPDETLICGLSVGVDGAIGTTYNIYPKAGVKIYESFKKGDMKAALEWQNKLNALIRIPLGNNYSYWKAIMTHMGFDMGYTVFPCIMPDEKRMSELKEKLDAIGFLENYN